MNTRANTITVLLADDDLDFLAQQKLQLENAGYTVLAADSQRQAEELLKKVKVDVAIVDLMMEHPDAGFALCHHVKKRSPRTPVILVTSVSSQTGLSFDAATREERSWVKADVMLEKPVRFEQLLREIERLLSAAA